MEIQEVLQKINIDFKESEGLAYNLLPFLYNRISTKELLHSEIITDFLNPEGTHGCGDVFFRTFIEESLRIKDSENFENIKVVTEKGIEGKRRIDILLTWGSENNKQAVIIENKLNDAIDQINQLRDYHNSIEGQGYHVRKVVYLPLNFYKSASNTDIDYHEGNTNRDIVMNLHAHDIRKWLETSLELCNNEIQNVLNLKQNVINARHNVQMYDDLLSYINTKYKTHMEIEKLHNKLNEEDLSKLISVAKLVNSDAWQLYKLKTIELELRKELGNEVIVNFCTSDQQKNYIEIYFKNYTYWIEVFVYADFDEYYLWIANNSQEETPSDNISKQNFKHYSFSNNHHYFDNPDKYKYEYPCKSQFEKLISDIKELLKKSGKQ